MNWNYENKSDFDDALALYDTAAAETPAGAIPKGKYRARLVEGSLDRARTGTASFCIKWEITDGEFRGCKLISRYWLTPKAIGRAKGDLLALGIDGKHLRGAVALPDVTAEISVVNRADEAGDLFTEIKHIRKIDDVASVNGPQAANGAGADTIQANEANAADGARETLPDDDGAEQSGDDDFVDTEYIPFKE